MFCIFILIFLIINVGSQASMTFQTGSSVTIPCNYDMKYIHHKKYWCRGTRFSSCGIQAYANNTNGNVTVTDYPAESLFTVTLNNLQTEDTGWYWCAVEINGWTDANKESLHITVKPDPDLSVKESRVSAEEGGNVTVQCLYSAEDQKTQKQWCRFKDKQCNPVGETVTSQNSAVHTRDDGRGSFSVQMSGLKKSDAGWYLCRAGDLQVPVHIAVMLNVSPNLTNNTHQESSSKDEMMSLWILVGAGLVLLLVLVSSVIYMLRKMFKKENQPWTTKKNNDASAYTPTTAMEYEGHVTYTSVFSSNKKQTDSLIIKDDEVTYGNMQCHTDRVDGVTYGNVHALGDRGDAVTYSTLVHK